MEQMAKCKFFTPDRVKQKARKNLKTVSTFDPFEDYKTPAKFQSNNDRFIPKRSTPLTKEIFNLPVDIIDSPKDISNFSQKEQDNLIYSNILE